MVRFGRRRGRHMHTGGVVLALDAMYESGGTRFAHLVAQTLHQDGEDVRLLVMREPDDDVRRFVPDPEVPLSYASAERLRLRQAIPAFTSGYFRAFRDSDVVVSCLEVGSTMLLGAVFAKLARRPFVSLVQSPLEQSIAAWEPARLRPALAWANRHVDLALCVSEGVRASVVANGLPPSKTAVLRVGADTAAVRAAGQPPLARPEGAPPRIVAMGRLEPVKGFDVLVRASALVKAAGLAHEIVIAGEGREKEALRRLIDDLGVDDCVRLTGFEAHPQPLLAGSDLFVLSSRFEGSGGTVLFEALVHAVPIIATDCVAGPAEVLDGGRYGRLIPVDDERALADALIEFLRDPRDLRQRAAQGPERAHEYDQREAARAMLREIDTRFGRARRRPR